MFTCMAAAIDGGEALLAQVRLRDLTNQAQIVGSHEARGPAKQILPDSAFLVKQPLHFVFQYCSQVAARRNFDRKASSMRKLITATGHPLQFTKGVRQNLSADLVHLIR